MTSKDALLSAASAWSDYDHPPRRAAVEQALAVAAKAGRRWTEEGCEHAVNARMHALLQEGMHIDLASPSSRTIRIATSARAPFSSFDAAIAVASQGETVDIWAPFDLVMERGFFAEANLAVDLGAAHSEVRGTITLDEDANGQIEGIPHLDLSHHFLQAVIDDGTSDEELLALAEDILLHDGLADTNVRLVWAPSGLLPDRLVAALDAFREELPAHPDSDGALGMSKAFLASAGVPHAWGDGYLVSRGDPEVQGPGHLRWSDFVTDPVVSLISDQSARLVVPESYSAKGILPKEAPCLTPGNAHRPPVGGWYYETIAAFVETLRT